MTWRRNAEVWTDGKELEKKKSDYKITNHTEYLSTVIECRSGYEKQVTANVWFD